MFTAPKDPLIGQAVGGSYVITRQLGEDGMGAVYLAAAEMLAGKPRVFAAAPRVVGG